MTRTIQKVGANDPCPCGRLKKYKSCCRGTRDWETMLAGGGSAAIRHMSTRNKNRIFINMVLDALQIDSEERAPEFPDFKRAFTSAAVRKIYEAIQFVWPDGDDLKRVLAEEAEQTSGLYVGQYEPDLILRGVTRHSLYADRILLIDPLPYPDRLRDEFNPLVHPEEHRANTLQWISVWFAMLPWIEEGIVGFVRAPGDFYPELYLKSIAITEKRHKHPELIKLRQTDVGRMLGSRGHEAFREHIMLSYSDHQLREMAREHDPAASDEAIEALIRDIQRRRDRHPYFLHPEPHQGGRRSSEFYSISSGTNYEEAKLIALHSRSYVMTDLRVRWKEIEIDREESGIDAEAWSPFAKAFHGLPLKFLDSVPVAAALAIRKEGRLESLRYFLRRVWHATAKTTPFDDANVPALAAELTAKVSEADAEWRKIDRDLLKWLGAEAAGGLLAAAPLVASGQAAFAGAAAILAGAATVTHSTMKRRAYKLEYPAGFFVDLAKGRYQ
jgi:hypothetical protein